MVEKAKTYKVQSEREGAYDSPVEEPVEEPVDPMEPDITASEDLMKRVWDAAKGDTTVDHTTDPNYDPLQDPTSFDFFMNQFKETSEGKAILQDMYNGHAEFALKQFDDLKKEAASQQNLLDDLIDQSKTGTGLFSPVKFMLNGQEISFVPRMNRAQAEQEATMSQRKIDTLTSLFGGSLALDKFKQDSYQFEESGNRTDRSLDQNEPGILDYVKGAASLIPGVGTIGKIFDIF